MREREGGCRLGEGIVDGSGDLDTGWWNTLAADYYADVFLWRSSHV